MLYEYHTDTTRMLTELGRMFVAIHSYKSFQAMCEDAQFIIGKMISKKIQDERDEMIRLGERMERIERQRMKKNENRAQR